jgi:hypothetical protein
MHVPPNRSTRFQAGVASLDGFVIFQDVPGVWNRCNPGERWIRRGQFELPSSHQAAPLLGANLLLVLPDGDQRPIVVMEVHGATVHFRSKPNTRRGTREPVTPNGDELHAGDG